MGEQPDADIMENGLEQLREMIARDRNHPSSLLLGTMQRDRWPESPGLQLAKRHARGSEATGSAAAVFLRLHSLRKTPERDVPG